MHHARRARHRLDRAPAERDRLRALRPRLGDPQHQPAAREALAAVRDAARGVGVERPDVRIAIGLIRARETTARYGAWGRAKDAGHRARCYDREVTIRLRVNGADHTVAVDPDTPLLFVLADDLGLRGPRFGCGMAQCGSCTVMLRGQPVRSCVLPVRHADGADVVTLEGLGTPDAPHPLQQAFIDEGASQCGFCLSGVILTAKAVLDAKPDASDAEIRLALGGVLCRCFTHTRMLRAIRRYADGLQRTR